MFDFKMIREAIVAAREGRIGDAALLEFVSYSRRNPELNALLSQLDELAPVTDLDALRSLPEGTLGREYARFLEANGIEPFTFGEEVRARVGDRPYALRSMATHDLHHMLTGFDTGLAGETGVYAFTVGQGTATGGKGLLWMLRFVYPLLSPTQVRRVWHNARVGLAMGRAARTVVTEPIEEDYDRPLTDVRRGLGIPDPEAAGVMPSGTSFVIDYAIKRLLGQSSAARETSTAQSTRAA